MSNTENSNKKDRNQRHKRAMRRKKEHVDSRIAEATIDKGLLVVLTGNGKGKSLPPSACSPGVLGMVCDAEWYNLSKGFGSAANKCCLKIMPWWNFML